LKKYAPHFALFFVNALYAASHVLAKGIMPIFLQPSIFILFRAAGAMLLFWIVFIFRKREKIEKKDWLTLFWCGLFGVAINQLCFFHGLNLSSALNAGIIMAVNPMMVLILSAILLGIAISKQQLFGIIMGATGVIMLTYSSAMGDKTTGWGEVLLLCNSLSYAIYLIIAKPLMKKYSPLTVITYTFTFGALLVLLYPPTFSQAISTDFSIIPQTVWIKIIYVIVGVTFLTYLLTIYALKYLTATVSSVYIYLQPVLVIVFAFLFAFLKIAPDFTQIITIQKIGWMLLIFFGVYFTSRIKK
jgi:drug/metabolite transporter (DMT)-like permease